LTSRNTNMFRATAMAILSLFLGTGVSAADEDTLVITFYHYPPELRVQDGIPSGIYFDQLEDIAKRAGYKVEWLLSDIDEEAAMLNAGRRAFCTTGRMPTAERAKIWKFLPYLFDVVPGDIVLTRTNLVDRLKKYSSIADVAKDSGLKGVLLKSGIYGSKLDAQLKENPKWISRSAAMDMQLMKMVLAGRADWTIVPRQQWAESIELNALAANLVEIPNFGAHPDYPIFVACSRALSDDMYIRLSSAMGAAGFEPGTIPQ